jgi:heme/copper-type cytochrome/quinol oxidase subunit 2
MIFDGCFCLNLTFTIMKIKTVLKVDEKGNVYIAGSTIIIYIISVVVITVFVLFYMHYKRKVMREEVDRKYENHQKKEYKETGFLLYSDYKMET